ncbi:hypothetical protein C0J52_23987 [Blattella germanica]|nr:hypothetical protein C0J52_23987 [Blattella germanica]
MAITTRYNTNSPTTTAAITAIEPIDDALYKLFAVSKLRLQDSLQQAQLQFVLPAPSPIPGIRGWRHFPLR